MKENIMENIVEDKKLEKPIIDIETVIDLFAYLMHK